jgi:hypothetical protein
VPNARGEQRNAWQLFAFTRIEEAIVLERPRTILSVPRYFSGMKLKTGEYFIVDPEIWAPSKTWQMVKKKDEKTTYSKFQSPNGAGNPQRGKNDGANRERAWNPSATINGLESDCTERLTEPVRE